MKKVLFVAALLCLATASFAQFSGGLKGGLNMASAKWESDDFDVSEKYSGIGFHVGLYGNFLISDAFSIQPEILYNSLLFDTEEDFGEDLTASYLSIPVMFRYGFSENMFFVEAGPQVGILLSTDPDEFKDEDGLTGTDFTLNLGGGVNFGKFNATLRYGIGLANIAGDSFTDSIDDFSIKNSNFQVSVGYTIFGGE